jgi:hypothetical protein
LSAIRRATALGAVLAAALSTGLAGADSFTPVRLTITTTPIARRHAPLAVTVRVSADPGALDTRSGPLWIHVKLAAECGGTYTDTPGVVLLDKRLSPQPSTGRPYSALARGSGKPRAYGVQTVCTWLDDEGDGRTFESDQSTQVNVSARCTRAAARYDAARRQRHRRSAVAERRRRKTISAARRAARRACGPGVPL